MERYQGTYKKDNMKFIQLKYSDGTECLVNLDNVSCIQVGNNDNEHETEIYFVGQEDDFITVAHTYNDVFILIDLACGVTKFTYEK